MVIDAANLSLLAKDDTDNSGTKTIWISAAM